jgi:hypothetical protein
MTRRGTTAQQQLLTSIVRAGLHVHGFCTSIRFRSYVEATGLRHVPDAWSIQISSEGTSCYKLRLGKKLVSTKFDRLKDK